MYLDKMFNKHSFIYIMPKKLIVGVFSFLGEKPVQIKKSLQNSVKRTLLYYKLKAIFKCLENIRQSAISDHLLTCDCNINFNDFTILSKHANNFNLLIEEGLLIAGDNPFLRKQLNLSH